jgi:hypothetical protein
MTALLKIKKNKSSGRNRTSTSDRNPKCHNQCARRALIKAKSKKYL